MRAAKALPSALTSTVKQLAWRGSHGRAWPARWWPHRGPAHGRPCTRPGAGRCGRDRQCVDAEGRQTLQQVRPRDGHGQTQAGHAADRREGAPPVDPPRTRTSAKGWPLPCRRVSSSSATVVPGAWSGRRAISACGVNGPGGVWLKCRGTASGASMPGGSGENRRVMATPGRAAAGPSTRRHPEPVPAGIHGGRVSPTCMAWYAVAVTRTPASGVRCGRVRRGAAATLAQ